MLLGSEGIHAVPDARHVPPGAITLGDLVNEALRLKRKKTWKTRARRNWVKRVHWHVGLWKRWSRMALRDKRRIFPPDHPIHRKLIVWERYVCRFAIDAEWSQRNAGVPVERLRPISEDEEMTWLASLHFGARIALCEESREMRRRFGLTKKDEKSAEDGKNELASVAYSSL